MLEASTMQINEATRMSSAVDQFMCQLCKFIAEPYPQECPQCNLLFCENCVKMQLRWQCPVNGCRCKAKPQTLHRNVKEILDMLLFTCPGCGVAKKYKQIFEHVKECDQISQDHKMSEDSVKEKILANVPEAQNIPHLYSTMSKFIHVFDKDSKQVLMYNRMDNKVTKCQIDYRQTEGNF